MDAVERKLRVFISYSRRDKVFARRLYDALTTAGYQNWVDWESIPAASNWASRIFAGIEEADAFLFIVSGESLRSKACHEELAYAFEKEKRIFPIIRVDIDSALEKELLLYWHEAANQSWEENARENLKRLKTLQYTWMRRKAGCTCEWDDARKDVIDPACDNPACDEPTDNFENAIKALSEDIGSNSEYIRWYTDVALLAEKWNSHKVDSDFLLSGSLLNEAADWYRKTTDVQAIPHLTPKLTDLQRQFIDASLDHLKRQKLLERARNITLSFFIIAFSIAIIGTFYFSQRAVNALQNEADANTKRATALAESTVAYTSVTQAAMLANNIESSARNELFNTARRIFNSAFTKQEDAFIAAIDNYCAAIAVAVKNSTNTDLVKRIDPIFKYCSGEKRDVTPGSTTPLLVSDILRELANACLRSRQNDCAETGNTLSIDLNPNQFFAYTALAATYREKGQPDLAFSILTRLENQLKDTNTKASDDLALAMDRIWASVAIRLSKPDYTEIVRRLQTFERSEKRLPGQEEALFLLAKSYAALDQKENACKMLTRFQMEVESSVQTGFGVEERIAAAAQLQNTLNCVSVK